MKKFIINNNILKLANVQYHKEIEGNHSYTRGGGFWHEDKLYKRIYLYGRSHDFGSVNFDQLKDIIQKNALKPKFEGYSFYFSTAERLETAIENAVKIE